MSVEVKALKGSGLMQKVISNKSFSRSDPSIYISVDKTPFGRTLSSGHLKPAVADFYIPLNQMQPKGPSIFKSWELMKLNSTQNSVSKSKFMILDPLRVIGDFSRPPKKFFRTFWRSTARKLVDRCGR